MHHIRIQDLKPIFYKQSLNIYMLLKNKLKAKKGPHFKTSLLEQIVLTLFKLKYSLPDRILESLFKIDHVTISRYVLRISKLVSNLNIQLSQGSFYIVDTTTIRIGKDKTAYTFSGYKHHHGLKYQCIINDQKEIVSITDGIESSIHDKHIFETQYQNIFHSLNKQMRILGDNAYVGLRTYNVQTPLRRNELEYKQNKTIAKKSNSELSNKRVQVEHVFAHLKKYRILTNVYYYTKNKLDMFIRAICNLYNLSIKKI